MARREPIGLREGAMYEQERVEFRDWTAWHVDNVDGAEQWMLAYSGDYTEVRAEALVTTVRERRLDMTGRNASGFRYSTKTEMRVTFRVGWRKKYALKDPLTYYAGRKGALREALKWLRGGHHKVLLRAEMDWAAHLAGATHLERLDCWDEDDDVQLRNLAELLERYAK